MIYETWQKPIANCGRIFYVKVFLLLPKNIKVRDWGDRYFGCDVWYFYCFKRNHWSNSACAGLNYFEGNAPVAAASVINDTGGWNVTTLYRFSFNSSVHVSIPWPPWPSSFQSKWPIKIQPVWYFLHFCQMQTFESIENFIDHSAFSVAIAT